MRSVSDESHEGKGVMSWEEVTRAESCVCVRLEKCEGGGSHGGESHEGGVMR